VRESLRAQVEAVGDTAKVIATEHTEMRGRFQYARKDHSDRTLIATARSFAEAAPPFKALFVQYELTQNFIESLEADADALEQQIALQNEGSGARINTNASIGQGLEGVDECVGKLDVIVRNKYRNDPAKLAAWESAHRLERAARSKRSNGTPQTPQTPQTP
jgi:hypothetical protein